MRQTGTCRGPRASHESSLQASAQALHDIASGQACPPQCASSPALACLSKLVTRAMPPGLLPLGALLQRRERPPALPTGPAGFR